MALEEKTKRRQAEALSAFEQGYGAGDVIVEIGQRIGHRLADRLQAREMDHRLGGKLGDQRRHRVAVAQVGAGEAEIAVGKLLDPRQRHRAGIAQIVDHMRFMPGAEHLDQGVAADIARAAGDQDPHVTPPKRDPPTALSELRSGS